MKIVRAGINITKAFLSFLVIKLAYGLAFIKLPKLKNHLEKKFYESMTFPNPLQVGAARNLPCPCGSGKKTKKCHGAKTHVTGKERSEIIQMLITASNKIAENFNDPKV